MQHTQHEIVGYGDRWTIAKITWSFPLTVLDYLCGECGDQFETAKTGFDLTPHLSQVVKLYSLD